MFVSVREGEDNVAQYTLFQLLEGSLRCGSPVPNFFHGESGERGGDIVELWEELMVKVTDTKERTDVFRILVYRPV